MRYELVYKDTVCETHEEFSDFEELLQYLEDNKTGIKHIYRCTKIEDVDISYLGFKYSDV